MKVAIIDYGAGNIGNVKRAAARAGLDAVVTNDREEIEEAGALILPGVGAMGDMMEHLNAAGLTAVLKAEVNKGKKLAGICLGMQALFDSSEEGGEVKGLGFIPGKVVHFPAGSLKVPHMGWNELKFRRDHWTASNLPAHPYVYFVHSYYKVPSDTEDVIAISEYGVDVPAIVARDNVVGFQFHPEKSGNVGLVLWKNLAEWLTK